MNAFDSDKRQLIVWIVLRLSFSSPRRNRRKRSKQRAFGRHGGFISSFFCGEWRDCDVNPNRSSL